MGRQLIDRFQIQSYEDFVDNAATRVLGAHDECFYIDYDCNLWEYNTKGHDLKKIYDAHEYINDSEGSIEAFSPVTKDVYLTLPREGELVKINILTKQKTVIQNYHYASVIINPTGEYGVILPNRYSTVFHFLDLVNNTFLEEHRCGNEEHSNNDIKFVSQDVIEVVNSLNNEKSYYSMPEYGKLENYIPQPNPILTKYAIQLNDTTNVMSVYYGTMTTSLYDTISHNSEYDTIFSKLVWDRKLCRMIIPETRNAPIPDIIDPYGYALSPMKKYALINSRRGSLYLVNLLDGSIARCFSDFSIMDYNLYSVFWDNNDEKIGLVAKLNNHKLYDIIILDVNQGDVVLRFESCYYETSFSKTDNSIVHSGQRIPFPNINSLMDYFLYGKDKNIVHP